MSTAPGNAPDFPPAAFLAPLAVGLVDGLALGDDHEQPPQVIAVIEPGITSAGGPADEAVEGAQGGIFLVGHGPGRTAEPVARQPDQGLEIALPELLGGIGIPGLEGGDPDGDGVLNLAGHAVLPRLRAVRGS